ncbi:hypothetical protein [Mesorhizobium sp. WSM2561]|uniref:hypothetical protein n=1 Tax=Mesorhizobium sp. WSM2561 TaxID=1040985 RepID=UPI000488AB1F|nr:hypothetical protein [Mesorhizobium sp. WSM2561]
MTNVRFGEVEYLELPEVRKIGPADIMRLPFLKRVGFTDEDELRIVIETNADQQGAIYIDCPLEWIDRIYINPWLPKQQADSLIATLNEIDGCEDVPIRRSFLIDSSTWKTAGDRAAGKETERKLKLKAPVKKALRRAPVKKALKMPPVKKV